MKKLVVTSQINEKIKDLILGCIYAKVNYQKYNAELWKLIDKEILRISAVKTEHIKDIPQIKSSREAYKALGKEPARYRLSAEALHRRIIKGRGIYQISNIVDVINLSSVITGYSIGGYDASQIQGNILFDTGKADDRYEAIGRGIMNIESLPVFRDDVGAFGSPTSDSIRTMISNKTKEILLIVINFGGHDDFHSDLNRIKELLIEYCRADELEIKMI